MRIWRMAIICTPPSMPKTLPRLTLRNRRIASGRLRRGLVAHPLKTVGQ